MNILHPNVTKSHLNFVDLILLWRTNAITMDTNFCSCPPPKGGYSSLRPEEARSSCWLVREPTFTCPTFIFAIPTSSSSHISDFRKAYYFNGNNVHTSSTIFDLEMCAGQSQRMYFKFLSHQGHTIFSNDPLEGAMPDPTANTTQTVDDNYPMAYSQAHSMFFIIAGMASMLLLILISIALLCYSHYLNHIQERHALEHGPLFPGSSSSESSFDYTSSNASPHPEFSRIPIYAVQVPGQTKPTFFAHPAPLPPDRATSDSSISCIVTPFTDSFTERSPSPQHPRRLVVGVEEAESPTPLPLQPPEPSVNVITIPPPM